MELVLKTLQIRRKTLQFLECARTNLIARLTMESQFDGSVLELPGEHLAFELIHELALKLRRRRLRPLKQPRAKLAPATLQTPALYGHEACLTPYISSISSCSRAAISSRFSLPLAVSNPFSI